MDSMHPSSSATPREQAPRDVELRSARLLALARRMTDNPDLPFCVPGLAVIISRSGDADDRLFVGVDGAGTPIREHTLFPITSASKLAIGLAILQLVDHGLIAFEDALARHEPHAAAAQPGVTVRALLSHTSGLPLDLDPARTPFSASLNWAGIAAGCASTPLAHEPGTRVQYSNVAYGLLAMVIERVTGADFKTVLKERVLAPLGIEAYIGRIPPRRPAVVVDIDSVHVGTNIEPYNSEFWWQLGTPWAGIHSTADGLLLLLRAYLDSHPAIVGAQTIAEARRDQTGGLPGGFATTDPFLGFRGSRSVAWPQCSWGLALELRGDKRPHWTPATASPNSFGQIGASGCIAWCDPGRGTAWVALAPRTTDNGWLLRHGPSIGSIALQAGSARP